MSRLEYGRRSIRSRAPLSIGLDPPVQYCPVSAYDCALRCMISTAGRTEESQASEGEGASGQRLKQKGKANGQRLMSGRAPASSRLLCRGQTDRKNKAEYYMLREIVLECRRLSHRRPNSGR